MGEVESTYQETSDAGGVSDVASPSRGKVEQLVVGDALFDQREQLLFFESDVGLQQIGYPDEDFRRDGAPG